MTKDDLISRQAAIDAVERNAYRHTYIDQIVDIIKALPSAQPVQWIPCSERLPKNPTDNYNLKEYLVCNARGWVTEISWCDGWNCCFDKDGNLYKDNEMKDIIAWMPLPEPYKEGDE